MLVYADHASTSLPTLFPASCTESWANPSNNHPPGLAARAALEEARDTVARLLNAPPPPPEAAAPGNEPAPPQILFTANGTEGDNLVLQGHPWDYIVTTATEHTAVYFTAQFLAARRGVEVVYLAVDGTGGIRTADVDRALALHHRPGRVGLVSLMYVNNETGTMHDLPAIAAMVRRRGPGIWFHSDAVQAPGHVPHLDVRVLGVDFLTVSAHKFHGPGGVGFLYQRDPRLLRPCQFGGHQQGGLRPGTEPVGLVRGMVAALADALAPATIGDRLAGLRRMTDALWDALARFIVAGIVLPTGAVRGGPLRAPHHVSFCVRGHHRRTLLKRLEDLGVAASGGSACSTGSALPSHVLAAMDVPTEYIQGSLRFTFSHTNTPEEVQERVIPAVVKLLTECS